MLIEYSSRAILQSISFSDCMIEGFVYKYDTDTVTLSCLNQHERKYVHLNFCHILMLNMQSCNLWGPGNEIYDICNKDDASVLAQLKHLRSINQNNLDKSKLYDEQNYVCISVCLNSGDELTIVCKSLEIMCDDYI